MLTSVIQTGPAFAESGHVSDSRSRQMKERSVTDLLRARNSMEPRIFLPVLQEWSGVLGFSSPMISKVISFYFMSVKRYLFNTRRDSGDLRLQNIELKTISDDQNQNKTKQNKQIDKKKKKQSTNFMQEIT